MERGKWVACDNDKKAQPLFPEHKTKDFLLRQKSARTVQSWESLYQQNPVKGGDMFPAAQYQHGHIGIVAADWNRPWLQEHEQFPSGKYKDQAYRLKCKSGTKSHVNGDGLGFVCSRERAIIM